MSNDTTLPHYVIEGDFIQDSTTNQRIMSIQNVINNIPIANLKELLISSGEMNKFVLSYCKKCPDKILSPLLDMFIKTSELSIEMLTEKLGGSVDQQQLCSQLSNRTICNEFLQRVDMLKSSNASSQDVSVYNAVMMAYQRLNCDGKVACDTMAPPSTNNNLQTKKRKTSLHQEQSEQTVLV